MNDQTQIDSSDDEFDRRLQAIETPRAPRGS